MLKVARTGLTRAILMGSILSVTGAVPNTLAAMADFVVEGSTSFVAAHVDYALSSDAKDTGACPQGMTEGMQLGDYAAATSAIELAEKSGGAQSPEQAFIRVMDNPDVPVTCLNPELADPDPKFRTVTGPNIPAYGIDLDGQFSRTAGKVAPGTCAHEDFLGMNGEQGADNQFFRVVGCSDSFQSSGALNENVDSSMITGMWGMLFTLNGVDDIRNDDNVEVGIYANADPIQVGPDREPLPFATYAMDQDPRFRAITRGRITDGILTTDPVDVRFHFFANAMSLERPLQDAVLKMTLSDNGSLDGYLAGYTPVEAIYDLQYGFRKAKDASGALASRGLRATTATGLSLLVGHTCNGAYHALYQLADADPDPATGKCTSISTQYRIKAIQAFVVDVATKSLNDKLRVE